MRKFLPFGLAVVWLVCSSAVWAQGPGGKQVVSAVSKTVQKQLQFSRQLMRQTGMAPYRLVIPDLNALKLSTPSLILPLGEGNGARTTIAAGLSLSSPLRAQNVLTVAKEGGNFSLPEGTAALQAPLQRRAEAWGMAPDAPRSALESMAWALNIPQARIETASRHGLFLLIALYNKLQLGKDITVSHDKAVETAARTTPNVVDMYAQASEVPDFVYVYDEDEGSFQVVALADNAGFGPVVGGMIDAPVGFPWSQVEYIDNVIIGGSSIPILRATRAPAPEIPLSAQPDVFGSSAILDYAALYDDPLASVERILQDPVFHPYHTDDGHVYSYEQILQRIGDAQHKQFVSAEQFRAFSSDEKAIYRPERLPVHEEILDELFDGWEDKVSPHPTFIALGGRGGSGKSRFEGEVYDREHYVVLDVDRIKTLLPEYEGYNAQELHQEARELLERALRRAAELRVNVVLDFTMNTYAHLARYVQYFTEAGFRTEAHYMFVPRQEAAKRVLRRFLNEPDGRYVPLQIILNMRNCERNFDAIKDQVDAWSFSDNNGPFGSLPRLVARKGEFSYQFGGQKWIGQ